MTIYIKNMVCDRCTMAVKFELMKFGIVPVYVNIGEIELENELTEFQYNHFNSIIQEYGFEILGKSETQVMEEIKRIIFELLNNSNNHTKKQYSVYIEQRIEKNYTDVDNLFSEIKSMTLEQFITLQRIEKAKGLLEYSAYKLAEIANDLGYSNISNLSVPFKKVTGFTPNYFRDLKKQKKDSYAIAEAHQEYDLSLINKSNIRTVSKIKNIIVELVTRLNETKKINFYESIERKLKVDFKYLNKLFSEIEEVSIDQYILFRKIEKAKELIVYKEFNINTISEILGHNDVDYLAVQLKQITGLRTCHFENIKYKKHLLQDNFRTTNNIKRIRKSIRVKMK